MRRDVTSDKSCTVELMNELQQLQEECKNIYASQITDINPDKIQDLPSTARVGYSPTMMINSYDIEKLMQAINYLKLEKREVITKSYTYPTRDYSSNTQLLDDEGVEIETTKNKTTFSIPVPENFDGRNSFVDNFPFNLPEASSQIPILYSPARAMNTNEKGRVGFIVTKNEKNIIIDFHHYTNDGAGLWASVGFEITYWRRL